MATWKDSLALRNRLASLWRSPEYQDRWARHHPYARDVDHDFDLFVADQAMMMTAPVYHVGEEAVDVTRAALKGFRPEPLLPSDLISPSGVLHLAAPLFTDLNEALFVAPSVAYPALVAWWPARLFVGPDGKDSFHLLDTDEEPGDGIFLAIYSSGLTPWLIDMSIMRFGKIDRFSAISGTGGATSDVDLAPNFFIGIQVVWRLLQQKVFLTEARRTGGKKSRRASKIETVNLVGLPRRVSASQGKKGAATSTEWSHRIWVNPFWRNQWYPSIQAHRQKLVRGHVRGPQDKPIVIKERVFDARKAA